MKILKVGDKIQWSFDNDHAEHLRNRTFIAKIAAVTDDAYGVYAEYGQDYIPFKNAEKVNMIRLYSKD